MVDHLLLNCTISFDLWSFAFRSFGMQRVLLEKVIDLLCGWRNWVGKHSLDIWNMVSMCLM
jgi:hypothetical protein